MTAMDPDPMPAVGAARRCGVGQGPMISHGTTQQSSAPFNRRIVLDAIRRQGSISRREIVERVSLSPQTVANITNDLQAIGLIMAKRRAGSTSRGQPPIAFELNPQGGCSIGISVEPGRLKGALVNLVGVVLARCDAQLDTDDACQLLASMVGMVGELKGQPIFAGRLWGVGVALPGQLCASDEDGAASISRKPFDASSVLDQLCEAVQLPVFHSVESVAGALGETLYGVARSLDNFFYLHLGMELGGTLMVNRAAYGGSAGNATEIGHIPVVPNGRACHCGSAGCLERYVSLRSLRDALGIDVRSPESSLVERLRSASDEGLNKWCRAAADCLRVAVCVIENMLDPRSIVIGGSAPKFLVEHLVALAQPLQRSVRSGVAAASARILLSERQEESSILGAAVLPVYERLSPRFEVLPRDGRVDADFERLMGEIDRGPVSTTRGYSEE